MTGILAEPRALREADLPTHGSRTLANVHDSGPAGLDEPAAAAHATAASAEGKRSGRGGGAAARRRGQTGDLGRH